MAAANAFQAAYPLSLGGLIVPGYAALYALIVNLVLSLVLTPVFDALGTKGGDETEASDYANA